MRKQIDEIEKIILDFNSPFTESNMKSILILIQYFSNHHLSNHNKISNIAIINIDEDLSNPDQQNDLEDLIISSMPKEDLSFSLFAVYFQDHWNSFVTYSNQNKIYAKYNDSRGNQAPEILKKALDNLHSKGTIEDWEDCKTIIPGGRSNDSGSKSIINMLETVYKPGHTLKNLEMPLKYYEILRISYVIYHVSIEIFITPEIRQYLLGMLQMTHNLSDIADKTDWLEEMIKNVCIALKDTNPSLNYVKILNICQEALEHLSPSSSLLKQDMIEQYIPDHTITEASSLYSQTFSKTLSLNPEKQYKTHAFNESDDLDYSISPVLDIHNDQDGVTNQIQTKLMHPKKVTDKIPPNLSNNTPIQTRAASFDETTNRISPFGDKEFSLIRSCSEVIPSESNEIKKSANIQESLNHEISELDEQFKPTPFDTARLKDSRTKFTNLKNTLSSFSPSKMLKKSASNASEISAPLLVDDSLNQSLDLCLLTQSLDLGTFNPLLMQTTDSIDTHNLSEEMLHTVNLGSGLWGNTQDLNDNVEKEPNAKTLIGETICKTH